MIQRKDFLALNFYKKTSFYGSYKNMNYRIAKVKIENEETSEDVFEVTYWPGPLNLASTDDSLKQTAQFPFSEEGICAVADFLNEQYNKQIELWQSVQIR